jgi:Ca2+-binding RTX toxin-like protein
MEDNKITIEDIDGNELIEVEPETEEWIEGTDKNDIIFGTEWDDNIGAALGDDWVDAGDGDDYVDGGSGNDTVYGGYGNDTIYTADGNDWIDGGDGDDYANGVTGDDTIYGGSGNDVIDGGEGGDQLYGGTGADLFNFNEPGPDWSYVKETDTADTVHDFNECEGDKIILVDVSDYSVSQNGSDWTITWLDTSYHDILVKGSDPTGSIDIVNIV